MPPRAVDGGKPSVVPFPCYGPLARVRFVLLLLGRLFDFDRLQVVYRHFSPAIIRHDDDVRSARVAAAVGVACVRCSGRRVRHSPALGNHRPACWV